MRVLLIGPKHNGIERYMKPLYKGLLNAGLDVDWEGFDKLIFEYDEILQHVEILAKKISKEKYDIIHFHYGIYDMEQVLPLYMSKNAAETYIYSAHSIKSELFSKLGYQELQQEINQKTLDLFEHFIFFSSYGSDGTHLKNKKQTLLFYPSTHQYTSLDRTVEHKIQQQLNLPEHYVVMPGYPSPWKDFETIVTAYKDFDIPIPFVFAGPWWKEKIEKRSLSFDRGKIFFVDKELNEQEFLSVIRNSSFGALIYKDHHTRAGVGVAGNFLWEGKACIVTDALCLPEYIGDSGMVIPQMNAEALYVAIVELLSNPNYGKELGERAKQRAVDYFSWEHHISEHIRVYSNEIDQ